MRGFDIFASVVSKQTASQLIKPYCLDSKCIAIDRGELLRELGIHASSGSAIHHIVDYSVLASTNKLVFLNRARHLTDVDDSLHLLQLIVQALLQSLRAISQLLYARLRITKSFVLSMEWSDVRSLDGKRHTT